jgi:hypothetical protein
MGVIFGGHEDDAAGQPPVDKEPGWYEQELTRLVSDPQAMREFATQGPSNYVMSRAVLDTVEKLGVGADAVTSKLNEVGESVEQMRWEFDYWQSQGNGGLGAGALTLFGDDAFVSDAEIERNLVDPKAVENPEYSTRAKLLKGIGDPNDPNRALFINGIRNSESRAFEIALEIGEKLRVNLTPVYNPTFNVMYDIAQVATVNKQDLIDESTALLISTIRERLADQNRTEPLKLFPHSQGAALTSSALSHLTREERSQIEVLSFGGAAYTYPSGLKSVEVLVNVRDLVPNATGGGVPGLEKSGFYDDPNYQVHYVDFGTSGDFATSHNVDGYLGQYLKKRVYDDRWQATLARAIRGTDQ